MSLTISPNDLKFVIFASGHDYTLADSGNGEKQVFSHPFVPLNSVMYAGQWFFMVADENGEGMDAVKDDLAHCTFTPALGTAFDTEGEVTVECHYHREYIYDEATLVVDKTVSQTITVVDHGQITTPASYSGGMWYGSDIYEDGYCFFRPHNVNDLADISLCTAYMSNDIVSCSSIWWRVTRLGYGQFLRSFNLADITELQYADISNVTWFDGLIMDTRQDLDLSPLEGWDTSNVTNMQNLLGGSQGITSLKGLEKWDVSKVTTLKQAFSGIYGITDFEPLKDWNTKNVENLYGAFSSSRMTSLHGLEDWNVSKVNTLEGTFSYCSGLTNVDALAKWDTVTTTLFQTFSSCALLVDLKGLANLNLSECTTMNEAFRGCPKLVSLDGLENWDVSNVTSFYETFYGNAFLADISALADWDVSSCITFEKMFGQGAFVLSVDALAGWDVSNGTSFGAMFSSFDCGYADNVGKELWVNNMGHYFDYDGNMYAYIVGWTPYAKDASGVNGWTPSVTPAGAFTNNWSNIPAWN